LGLVQSRVQPAEVDGGERRECAASPGQVGPVLGEQPHAQGADETGAAVGAGAAAHTEEDAPGAVVQGVANQLSGAGRGGPPGGIHVCPVSARPEARDISTTEATPSGDSAYVACTGSPRGPRTTAARSVQPAARAAATVPSPPSAIGTCRTVRSGRARSSPVARCSASWAAASDPLH